MPAFAGMTEYRNHYPLPSSQPRLGSLFFPLPTKKAGPIGTGLFLNRTVLPESSSGVSWDSRAHRRDSRGPGDNSSVARWAPEPAAPAAAAGRPPACWEGRGARGYTCCPQARCGAYLRGEIRGDEEERSAPAELDASLAEVCLEAYGQQRPCDTIRTAAALRWARPALPRPLSAATSPARRRACQREA